MLPRCLGHRAPLLWLALPLMAGIAVAGEGIAPGPLPALIAALGAAAFAIGAARRRPGLWALALAAAMILAGNAAFTLRRYRPRGWDDLPPREARLSLRIERPFPQAKAGSAAGIGVIAGTDPLLREFAGQRIAYALSLRKGQSPPEASAVVSAAGLLSVLPRDPPAGSFDAALAGMGLNLRLARGRLIAESRPPDGRHRFSSHLAGRVAAILGLGLERHPALAAILRSMMLGRKGDLAPDQRLLFLHSGAMHLFAINGVHIGIVALSLHALLAALRCPRWAACAAVLPVLWLDVAATGASPSAMRAFATIGILEAAAVLRRPQSPVAALAASALAATIADPTALFSASFRMSYAVVAAILLFGLPLADRLKTDHPPFRHLPEPMWTPVQRAVARLKMHLLAAAGIGGAAAAVGAVTGIGAFGLLTPGALLSNLFLVPLASLVIAAGCASAAAGLAGAAGLSRLFNRAAGVTLGAMAGGMGVAVRIPGAWLDAHFRAPWLGSAALAALLAAMLAGYSLGWRRDRGGFRPPLLLLAAVLAFGVRFGQPARIMKSSYELAMERLSKADPGGNRPLTADQKARLAGIDLVYKGRIAEREIFLKQQLDSALAAQNAEEAEKIAQQIAGERARLEEDREAEKERVRNER
jgi:competence protein ComEC